MQLAFGEARFQISVQNIAGCARPSLAVLGVSLQSLSWQTASSAALVPGIRKSWRCYCVVPRSKSDTTHHVEALSMCCLHVINHLLKETAFGNRKKQFLVTRSFKIVFIFSANLSHAPDTRSLHNSLRPGFDGGIRFCYFFLFLPGMPRVSAIRSELS